MKEKEKYCPLCKQHLDKFIVKWKLLEKKKQSAEDINEEIYLMDLEFIEEKEKAAEKIEEN